MDAGRYRELLEDVQIDINESDRAIAELRSLEGYVRRKLNARGSQDANEQGHYRQLLDEVLRDIDTAEHEGTELRNVAKYVRRKLQSNGGGEEFPNAPERSRPAAAEPARIDSGDGPRAPREASRPEPKKVAPVVKTPAAVARPAPKPSPRPPSPPAEEPDAMQTIEFGPDGFPMT